MTVLFRSRLLAAAAVLGVLTLASCAPDAPDAAPSGPTTPTPVPTAQQPSPSPSAPPAEVSATGIQTIALGEPFDETVTQHGAVAAEGCPYAATLSAGAYTLTFSRDAAADDASPVEFVSAATPIGNAAGTEGPRTAEGIGIGSTIEEARAVYPDAEEIVSAGDRRYLRVASDGDSALFLAFTDGEPVIWGLTATILDEPPYELCG